MSSTCVISEGVIIQFFLSLTSRPDLLRSDYMEHFETRDLKAFSAEPLLVFPTHYTGEPGYISDTETSTVWDNEKARTDWDRKRSGKTKEQAEISTEAQNSDVLQSPLDRTARDEL